MGQLCLSSMDTVLDWDLQGLKDSPCRHSELRILWRMSEELNSLVLPRRNPGSFVQRDSYNLNPTWTPKVGKLIVSPKPIIIAVKAICLPYFWGSGKP